MPKLPELKKYVRQKLAGQTMRDVAKQINISAASVFRIENGWIPDLETFGKVCQWLKISPAYFLGYDQPQRHCIEPIKAQIDAAKNYSVN